MANTTVDYIRVPATGEIYLNANKLIEWVGTVKAKYPELGKLADEFEGMVSNLKNAAKANSEKRNAQDHP